MHDGGVVVLVGPHVPVGCSSSFIRPGCVILAVQVAMSNDREMDGS